MIKKFLSILMMLACIFMMAAQSFAAGLADITAAVDLSTIETALSALFVAGIGLAVLALGYRKMKGGVNKV